MVGTTIWSYLFFLCLVGLVVYLCSAYVLSQEVKEDIMYKIADILEKNHLEFAYPTLTIHQTSKEDR